jgi:hypothetical protein
MLLLLHMALILFAGCRQPLLQPPSTKKSNKIHDLNDSLASITSLATPGHPRQVNEAQSPSRSRARHDRSPAFTKNPAPSPPQKARIESPKSLQHNACSDRCANPAESDRVGSAFPWKTPQADPLIQHHARTAPHPFSTQVSKPEKGNTVGYDMVRGSTKR